MVFPEPRADQALWVLPGGLQDRLVAGGFVSGAPLDRVAIVHAPERLSMRAGSERTVTIRVTHPAGGAPWPSLFDVDGGTGAVRVVASWPDGTSTISELPRTLLPGETAEVQVLLRAPSTRGEVVVGIDVLEEPGRVFDGGVPITVDVR
jgi:hypothetical protein